VDLDRRTARDGRRRARRAEGTGRTGVDAAQPTGHGPIVGTTKPHHLDDAIAAVDIELSDDELARLEEPYTQREVEECLVMFKLRA
jgi:hypothetical protein